MSASRRVEIGLLVALCFFLPLYEAPKNLAWLAYALVWLWNRARSRDFGGRADLWDGLIAAWIASGLIVAAFAGLHGSEWRGAFDLVRYGGVLWLVKRSRYESNDLRSLLVALVASTVVGLGMAHWRFWSGTADTLELNSVGHVNHTAIYLAIMLGACVAWLFSGGGVVAFLAAMLILVSVVMSASRGAIGVALVMLAVLGLAWLPRSRRPVAVAVALVAITVAAAWLSNAEVLRKQEANIRAHWVLSSRDAIWRTALVAWERYPLFGVGMDNYSRVKMDRVKAWRAEAGKDFNASNYFEYAHGHSLYLNTLAERGIVGTAPVAAVLALWLAYLLRYRPRRETADDYCLWWGAAAAAWMVTKGVGLVNTTLHHEHGLLAALFLGIWLSRLPRNPR